jgi:Holliday junction resolvase RusA-like endonuclease
MSESYRFDVTPRGKQRPRSTIQGGRKWTYTPRETQDAEDELRMLLLTKPRRSYPAEIPLRVSMVFTLLKAKSATRPWPTSGGAHDPDVDQLAKLVMDAFNGMLWEDDAQIVELRALKQFGPLPGIDMTVSAASAS